MNTAMNGHWRPVIALMASGALSTTAFFIMFPLLPIHLIGTLGMDATTAGLLLGLRFLLEQGGAVISGALADRMGYRRAIAVGLLLRSIGFASLGFATDAPGVILAILITAAGGSLFAPSSRAIIAYIVPPTQQQAAFGTISASWWLGQTIGPFIGALLISLSFVWVTTGAALGLAAASLAALLLLPSVGRTRPEGMGLRESMFAPMRDGDYRRYLLPHLASWAISTQILITLPLLATRIGGAQAIGTVFAVQAVTSLLVQIPLVRFVSARLAPLAIVTLSAVLSAVTFLGYAAATSVWQLVLLAAFFGLSQPLFFPSQAFIVARFAGPHGGAYFGLAGLAQGIGGSIGNMSAGALIDIGNAVGSPWLVWVAMAGVALLAAAGYTALGRVARIRQRLLAHLTEEPPVPNPA